MQPLNIVDVPPWVEHVGDPLKTLFRGCSGDANECVKILTMTEGADSTQVVLVTSNSRATRHYIVDDEY
jgi:hypothetical protein